MKAVDPFETSAVNEPATCNKSEDLNSFRV